jgi:phytoene desaturase
MSKKRIVIIGAGPGGLAAGMLLAHRGHDVTIYEKNDQVGGRNGAFHMGPYTFDIGPTFLSMLPVLEDLFHSTGRDLSDYLTLYKIDPMYRLVFGRDRQLLATNDPEKMAAEIDRLFPGNSAGYYRFLKKEAKKYHKLLPCIELPYSSFLDLLRPRVLKALPAARLFSSLFGVLGRYFKNDDLRAAFTFQAKYIGMSPWQAPGLFSIIPYLEHGLGIYHVRGGLNRISHAMARVITEAGGIIRTGRGVRKILVEQRHARGLLLEDGSKVTADAVVINADFAHAMGRLVDPDQRRKYTDQRLARMKYSVSTVMLYLGIDRRYPHIPHHNLIFGSRYREYVERITRGLPGGTDPPFYFQNASVTDTTLAPEGHSTIYALLPVPNNTAGTDWQKEKPEYRRRLLDLLEKKGGLTDLGKHIQKEKMLTPDDWEHQHLIYRGATFNLGHQLSQMLIFRPHNRFEEFAGCYLVGGGTHPASGLPTIYMSARISADLITGR